MMTDSSPDHNEGSSKGIRIGEKYQAVVPDGSMVLTKPAPKHESDHADLIWCPTSRMDGKKLDDFLRICLDRYNYKIDQALGMLCWHNYNIETALADLPNFTPLTDDWSVEDKTLFEQAFRFHGKDFRRIKLMLPNKSVANLVKYYYIWKKLRCPSVWSKDSVQKDDSLGFHEHNPLKSKRKPPRGMPINVNDIKSMINGSPGLGAASIKNLNAEIVKLKRIIQSYKTQIGQYRENALSVRDLKRIDFLPPERINPRWTQEESLLVVEGVRKHGKDFKALAEIIGNKTEAHVRSFYVNNERKYNLKNIISEHEAESNQGEDSMSSN